MLKALIRNKKAASVAEFATFSSLAFTLVLILYIGLNDMGQGFYKDTNRNPDMLSDKIIENCLTRTRANDTILPRQARPFNCFKLDQGNDRITIDRDDNIIYPGAGRDIVIAQAGARDTQIVYEGGDDIYHFVGGRGVVDLRAWKREEIIFDIMQKSPSSVLPGQKFDMENRAAHDLLLRIPTGTIVVANHFSDQPVDTIAFSDIQMSGEGIALSAIVDQSTESNDQILGTDMLDLVSPLGGNDKLQLFEGDDVITYARGNDRYDPGPGQDILEVPGVRATSATFALQENMNDISITIPGKGTILLIDQAKYPPGGTRIQFSMIQFDDITMRESEILVRAVQDQGTPGDDKIAGTRYSDTIRPGTGINEIYPEAGSDIIIFGGGTDTIYPAHQEGNATDILDVSSYVRSDLKFRIEEENDLTITTPDGVKITIKDQMSPDENGNTNIEIFRLKNEELPHKVLLQLYFSAPEK
jgi:Ca2+-binding RTX toxin-like protein